MAAAAASGPQGRAMPPPRLCSGYWIGGGRTGWPRLLAGCRRRPLSRIPGRGSPSHPAVGWRWWRQQPGGPEAALLPCHQGGQITSFPGLNLGPWICYGTAEGLFHNTLGTVLLTSIVSSLIEHFPRGYWTFFFQNQACNNFCQTLQCSEHYSARSSCVLKRKAGNTMKKILFILSSDCIDLWKGKCRSR